MQLLTGTATVDGLDGAVADLERTGERVDCTTQAFDAGLVADAEHLRRAVVLADRAHSRSEGIARERAVEVLLYAAGRRQIDRALAMGLTEGTTAAVVLADAEGSGAGGVEVHDGRPEPGEVGTDDPPEERERATLAAVCDLAWFEPGPVTLGDPERLRAFFDVGEAELAATDAALADLVRERVALLVVDR